MSNFHPRDIKDREKEAELQVQGEFNEITGKRVKGSVRTLRHSNHQNHREYSQIY